jgi:hypothetical protein
MVKILESVKENVLTVTVREIFGFSRGELLLLEVSG